MKIFSLASLKKDLPASLVVFLVALPLCLGIALASGAPLLSGLISGIIGGVVVGMLSGSQTSVSGPAAGLTAIVLAAIANLGSFDAFLLALVIAGLLQLLFGYLRVGIVANYFPSSVIKGLLAAIGIILIFKQIPHALGYDKDTEGDFSFFQQDGRNTFTELIDLAGNITPGAVIVSLFSIGLFLAWDKTRLKKTQVPPALVAVLGGTLLNELFKSVAPGLLIQAEHLVQIPHMNGGNMLDSFFTMPDWSQWSNFAIYTSAVTIAIVASLETLLNLEAIDKLDQERRHSPRNRELIAQGVGNVLCGLAGGLPVTSVVVRSSVNLNAGAKTKVSAITHGVLLLVTVLAIPHLLNRIPLSALAAVLLITGYKLASLDVFKTMYKKGISQFLPFLVTVVAIIFSDLLLGIVIGLAVGLFFVLRNNLKSGFRIITENYATGEVIRLKISQHATFLNKAFFQVALDEIPDGSEVIFDATDTEYIDPDVIEILNEFRHEAAFQRNIRLSMIGFREEYAIPDIVRYKEVMTRQALAEMNYKKVLDVLREGNMRFLSGQSTNRNLLYELKQTSKEQHPMAAILGCIDSRSTSELIFDLGLGDIFNARLAGNVVNNDVIGSLEFATHVAGAKLIVVLGHTNCGAVKAACDGVKYGHLTELLSHLDPAIRNETETTRERNSNNDRFVANVTVNNVKNMMNKIRQGSEVIDTMLREGSIGLVGAVHNLQTGKVDFIEFNEEWKHEDGSLEMSIKSMSGV